MIEITGVQAEPGGAVSLKFDNGRFTVEKEGGDPFWIAIVGLTSAGSFVVMLISLFGFAYLNEKLHLSKGLVHANAIVFFVSFGLFAVCGLVAWLATKVIEFFGSSGPKSYGVQVGQIAGIQYEQIDPQGGLRATMRQGNGDVTRFTVAGAKGPELYQAFDQLFRPAVPYGQG
ncbi:hypothetical protein [Kitasatospora aureofaciens]|uniref:hypothetical protein n=1 Tax=Kitasatospora aureofaciens TaxID=1894 RepID=UPI001C4861F1|nr:hypothetical protein [Kitasatospora aureofaciens]MBV6702561.1 hypothetical protein [Kitasatospora aureofaciens]